MRLLPLSFKLLLSAPCPFQQESIEGKMNLENQELPALAHDLAEKLFAFVIKGKEYSGMGLCSDVLNRYNVAVLPAK